MTLTLPQCVDVFGRMLQSLGMACENGAINNCGDVSKAFLTLLDASGIRGEIGRLVGVPEFVRHTIEPEELERGGMACHIIVKVGPGYYDWTRRQYVATSAFPHISNRAQLEAEGWEVEDVDAAKYLFKERGK